MHGRCNLSLQVPTDPAYQVWDGSEFVNLRPGDLPSCEELGTSVERLLAFRDSFTNGPEVLDNWDNSTSPCSWNKEVAEQPGVWFGVACDMDGTITGL